MTPAAFDLSSIKSRIGDRVSRTDVIDPKPLVQLAVALNRIEPKPRAGDPLPPGRHWLYFAQNALQSELRIDGIPRRTPPVPEVPLPRRMWGGARTDYLRPLRVGATVTRDSVVKDVYEKQGASGKLVFVVLRHEIRDESGVAIVEEHDYFFDDPDRSEGKRPPAKRAPDAAQWSERFVPELSLLFRYSAITFNAHRIHFDRAFARETRGYAGAVVHGPLTATLLLDLCGRNVGRPVRRFEYRGVNPLFDGAQAVLAGRIDGDRASVWAATEDGRLAMSATAEFV